MSFLAPLFLLGALAVGLPVVFHLIRRTSREKTVFSSLMFLMPTPPRVTRRSRLENIFLLLLRCLVLCLLALGFARPFIQRPVQADSGSGTAKRILVLLDTSASMRRASLWPEARAKAAEIVRQASPVDQIALFTFDRQVSRIVSFDQWVAMGVNERLAFATKRLDEMTPGWAATHLGNALISAAEALQESRSGQSEKFALRRVVLISDLQEGSHLDALQAFEWPKDIELQIEPVKTKKPTNAGLQLVTEAADAIKTDTNAGPRVRVSNSTDSKREQFQLGWARAGQPGFQGKPMDVYVPPGQSRIVQSPKMPDGLAEGRLVLTGDDEDFDNTVYVAPPNSEKINLFFLGRENEKDSVQQCLYYVKRAFQQTGSQIIQLNTWPGDAGAAPSLIESSPFLVCTDQMSDQEANAASRVLKSGKMALLVLKDAGYGAKAISRLTGIEGLAAQEAPTNTYAMLGQIDFEHPLFAPFASPRFSDFTKIHFWRHRRVDPEKLRGSQVLARFDNGDPALIQVPVGAGTLFVLTSGWQPADSQLALSSKFVPLLYSMLEQSGGIKEQLSQYNVGDPIPLAGLQASADTNQSALIHKPDGSQTEAKGDKFAQTDVPGVYTVTFPPSSSSSSSSSIPKNEGFQFAVNLDATESKTAPLPFDELQRLGLPIKPPPTQTAKAAEQKRSRLQAIELEQRQKLWKWLIVAALVVVVMETLLAGWLTRRTAPAT